MSTDPHTEQALTARARRRAGMLPPAPKEYWLLKVYDREAVCWRAADAGTPTDTGLVVQGWRYEGAPAPGTILCTRGECAAPATYVDMHGRRYCSQDALLGMRPLSADELAK